MPRTTYRLARLGLASLLLPALLALTALLAACGDSASADEPPKIDYGKTECTRCHMIISDERFAAGLVDDKAKAAVFDDMGEMILTVQEEGLNERRAWVHDYNTKEWIDATTATYAVSMDVVTPMGTGVSAFKTADDANTFASANGGMVMTWDQMLSAWKMEMKHP